MQIWLLVLGLLLGYAGGEHILAFFPFPAKSHHLVFGPLSRALALRGHNVTAVTPYPMEDPPPGYTEILVPNLMGEIARRMNLRDRSSMNFIEQVVNFAMTGHYFQKQVCENEKIRALFSSEQHFDAVVLESYFIQEIFSVLPYRFSAAATVEVLPCETYPWANTLNSLTAATVEVLPCETYPWANTLGGNPYNPAYSRDMKSAFGEPMTFLERLENTVASWGSVATFYNFYLPVIEPLVADCFPGPERPPPLVQMLSNKSLVLSNSHPAVNFATPSAPHFVHVGGLNLVPNKPLPQDIQIFMDGAREGVVYFSLGSNLNVSDVATDSVFRALVSAFGRIKQRVLWKWEREDFPDRPANVKISKWFPQQDVLAHENCKVFITHGGLLSIHEAVHYGVPIIGVPFFGDQQKNVKHAATFGYGLHLSYDNITDESLVWAIDQIISNSRYREKMKETSERFRDRPIPPMDTAIYWIEYVMRHGGAPHLRTGIEQLRWYQYMLLDVAAIVLLAIFCAGFLFYRTTKGLSRLVFCRAGACWSKQKTS